MTRLSPALIIEGGNVCCAACSHPLTRAGESWKKRAALSTVRVMDLPGAGSGVDPQVLIRQFACPACGRLLDSETALPDDPFLEDTIMLGTAP